MSAKEVKIAHASLFSGIGGAELAASWMGWDNKFHCEINPFCRKILEYHFPESKSYEDITKTDFSDWRGQIDVLTGGFPCQPFSLAGKRKGAEDNRYLWPQMLRAIREIRPTWVVGENVAGIITMVQPGDETEVGNQSSLFGESDRKRVLQRQEYVAETICRDLEREGYSVQPVVIPACSVGAPHRRDRVWFVANSNEYRDPSSTTGTGTESCRRDYFSQSCEWRNTTERIDGFHRISHDASYSDCSRLQEKRSEQQTARTAGCIQRDIADPHNKGLQRKRISTGHDEEKREETGRHAFQYTRDDRATLPADRWKNFPTQPPIRSRYDGISARLDGITFSKWRQESIKAYGNAMCPQVVYEIFRAIEENYE